MGKRGLGPVSGHSIRRGVKKEETRGSSNRFVGEQGLGLFKGGDRPLLES